MEEPENYDTGLNKHGYLDLYNSVDTTLMGFNTYKFIVDAGVPFPYPDKKNYVFSRNHTNIENNPVEFVSSDIVEFVSNLKNKEGADIWLVGEVRLISNY